MTPRTLFAGAALAALATFGLASCGGGGGNDPLQLAQAPQAQAPAADQTGVVGILIKDAPTLDFTRIMVDIESVELISDEEPKASFLVDKEIDLLELQNFYDMLALSDKVPVGEYEKIRLRVRSVVLWCLDATGTEVSEEADLPANGKIDLNPRSPFTVSPDVAILIEIDMHANKSIKVHTTGNNKYKFRPVVFVDIEQREAINGLVRVGGTVHDIDRDNDVIELCELDVALETDLDEECVLVNGAVRDARVFDENGNPIDFDDLAIMDVVTVFGVAVIVSNREDDDNGESSDDDTIRMIQIDAVVIQRGDPANLLSLDGRINTVPDADNVFEFDVFAGQDVTEGPLNVLLQDRTRIIDADSLADLEATAIQPDVVAEVSGILPTEPVDAPLNSILILIDPEGEQPREELNGVIDSIDDGTFTVSLAGEDPPVLRCVDPEDDARFFALVDGDDGTEIDEVSADYLEVGQTVAVFGSDPGGDACFNSDVMVVEAPAPAP